MPLGAGCGMDHSGLEKFPEVFSPKQAENCSGWVFGGGWVDQAAGH